jgi:short subunit dehydrogenase-like uncharacterized protein
VDWLIYGANGFTGELVARLAVRRGQRPVLAGRSADRVRPLATELGLEHRVFGLDDPAGLRQGLAGIGAVAHCAGPFAATAATMARACCEAGSHYLDITGEIEVFEQLRAMSARAEEAGVVLVPGAGFDVVPTDCLAAQVTAALPGAEHLDIAFLPGTSPSGGTARTALAGMGNGGLARINGVITPVPVRWKTVLADFPSGARTVGAVPWGDVSTAYYSTGVPNITAYTLVPAGAALVAPLLRLRPVTAAASALVGALVKGPGSNRRSRSKAEIWVRASLGTRTATATLTTPNPYDLTADSVVRAVARLADQASGTIRPGTHTPATAFGSGFVTELDGVVAGPLIVT